MEALFIFIFCSNCIIPILSILKGDQYDKLRFIWNPLPSMIIYNDVFPITNLNCKALLSIVVQKDKINDLIWLFLVAPSNVT